MKTAEQNPTNEPKRSKAEHNTHRMRDYQNTSGMREQKCRLNTKTERETRRDKADLIQRSNQHDTRADWKQKGTNNN